MFFCSGDTFGVFYKACQLSAVAAIEEAALTIVQHTPSFSLENFLHECANDGTRKFFLHFWLAVLRSTLLPGLESLVFTSKIVL